MGISVDTAVDIAKQSADIILLEKSLLVLDEGVLEGRKVFSNIVKYVRMGASSNFGDMFSVLGASVFVPFLPMRPIQILANNLLHDIGQAAIPTDAVEDERIQQPPTWDLKELTRFILFIGPCSSIGRTLMRVLVCRSSLLDKQTTKDCLSSRRAALPAARSHLPHAQTPCFRWRYFFVWVEVSPYPL